MRLKLDENLPTSLAGHLIARGHDADTVIDEGLEGQPDPVVVAAATEEGRMLVTLDRGIGDLRRYPPGSHAGVLVLRPTSQDPASVLDLVDRLLQTHDLDDLTGCVVIVESRRVRIRRPEQAR